MHTLTKRRKRNFLKKEEWGKNNKKNFSFLGNGSQIRTIQVPLPFCAKKKKKRKVEGKRQNMEILLFFYILKERKGNKIFARKKKKDGGVCEKATFVLLTLQTAYAKKRRGRVDGWEFCIL